MVTVPDQLSHLSTGRIPTEKKYRSQKIGLALKSFIRSALTRGMPNGASTVLFLIFCDGNIFKHGKIIINHKYKIVDINQTIIVVFAI